MLNGGEPGARAPKVYYRSLIRNFDRSLLNCALANAEPIADSALTQSVRELPILEAFPVYSPAIIIG